MQPSLSVNYNSQDGNGRMGVGWSLSALSSITLCPNTYGQDGHTAGVVFRSTDRLCLDGQHLSVVEGQYGASGSIYRTFYETFKKVQLYGDLEDSKSFFIVTQEDGTRYYYQMPVIPLYAPAPIAWFLTLKKDVYGNTISYRYIQPTPGEVIVSQITYTGRSIPGRVVPGDRVIRFRYEPRADIASIWLSGSDTERTLRLRSIVTGITHPADQKGLTRIREYYFKYTQSEETGRSLLKSVTSCAYDRAGNQHCLTPTAFSWSARQLKFRSPAVYPISVSPNGQTPVWLLSQAAPELPHFKVWYDYNADGRVDLAYIGTGKSPEVHVYVSGQKGAPPTDVNVSRYLTDAQAFIGDKQEGYFSSAGDAELLGDNKGTLAMMYSNGNGSNRVYRTSIPFNPDTLIGQFSGTGRADALLLQQQRGDTYELLLYKNVDAKPGQRAFSAPIKLLTFVRPRDKPEQVHYTLRNAGTISGSGYPTVFVMDGNAIAWIVFFEGNSHHVLSAHAIKPGAYGLSNTADIRQLYFMDINGDGLLDLVYCREDKTGTRTWWYQINTGLRFAAPINTGVRDTRPAVAAGDATFVAPIFADGKDNLVYPARLLFDYCLIPRHEKPPQTPLCSSNRLDQVDPAADLGIYSFNAINFETEPDGTYRLRIIQDLNVIGQAHRLVAGDILGTGLPQFISPFDSGFSNGWFRTTNGRYFKCPPQYGCGLHVSSSTNINGEYAKDAAPDMMIAVTPSHSTKYVWNYYPLADSIRMLYTVPALGSNKRYLNDDAYYFTSTMYVVGEFTEYRSGGEREMRYHYGDGGYNAATSSFEGFRWITAQQAGSVVRYTSWYHLQYPPYSGSIGAYWSELDYEPGDNLTSGVPGSNFIKYTDYRWDCQGPPDNEYSAQYHCVDSKSPTFLPRQRKIVE
ncbi:MAG: hypothetical protein WBR15_11180, partial [Gammaproteobacteria bacterium]